MGFRYDLSSKQSDNVESECTSTPKSFAQLQRKISVSPFLLLNSFIMSQSSDIFLPSAYDAPPSDFLEYVADSTPAQLFSPVTSGSQQTLYEPPNASECLKRVCPDRIRTYILYSSEMSDEFVNWWLQTDYGRKKRMTWDGKRAECWEHFDQVALDKSGKPGVMCQQCQKVLDHPGWAHSGTTSMNKHYNGVTCRKAASAKGQKPNIKLALEHAVCSGPYYRLRYIDSYFYF